MVAEVGMKKQLPCTHTLKIGLFLCGLLPLGLLAVATVRTTGQLVILVFAIVLVCVFSNPPAPASTVSTLILPVLPK